MTTCLHAVTARDLRRWAYGRSFCFSAPQALSASMGHGRVVLGHCAFTHGLVAGAWCSHRSLNLAPGTRHLAPALLPH